MRHSGTIGAKLMAGRKRLLKATHKKPVKSGATGGEAESKRKKAILDGVRRSSASVKATLQELGLTKSTYYRWLKLYKAKGLDGLETGSPVSDELWQRFADLEERQGRLLDERELSVEETQTIKSGEEKDKIRKPLDEKLSKEPEKTVALETEGPAQAAQPKTVKEPQGPADNTFKYVIGAVGALAFVIAILVLASLSNSNKFYFKQNDQMVEVWQGWFDPMGERLVASFSDPMILEAVPEQDSYTKKQAFGILYDYFVKRADELLNEGEAPDFKTVRSYLTHASNYVRSGSEREAIRMRLNSIEFLVLLGNTDFALRKTPLPDFQAAWGHLAKAVPVASTDLQKDILTKKLAAVEYALTSRKISKGEGELVDLNAEALKLNLQEGKGYGPDKSQEIDQEEIAKIKKWLDEFDEKHVQPAR